MATCVVDHNIQKPAQVLTALGWGYLSDHLGRRPVVVIGNIVSTPARPTHAKTCTSTFTSVQQDEYSLAGALMKCCCASPYAC